MATIYPNYQASQGAQQVPQPQYQAQQQQAQPVPVAYQSQASSTATKDPLFEALAKYITQGPGPSHTSTAEVESIINQYSDDDGRAYLQSIIEPPTEPMHVWDRSALASGSIVTDLKSLKLAFRLKEEGIVSQNLSFEGDAAGIFLPQNIPFNGEIFYFNKPDDIPIDTAVEFSLRYNSEYNYITIGFTSQVSVPEQSSWFASLSIAVNMLSLPSAVRLPNLTKGTGKFKSVYV